MIKFQIVFHLKTTKKQLMDINNVPISKQNTKSHTKKIVENIAHEVQKELTERAEIDITDVNIMALTTMISEYAIKSFDDNEYPNIRDILLDLTSGNDNQSFIVNDIGSLIRSFSEWRSKLPRVEIFYAVKCNSDMMILRTLANLGVGFDVASKEEITMITQLEVDIKRDKIIYANPCKETAHIQYARSTGIKMMTFDSEDELLKIKLFHPNAKLVLRILVDDSKSKMPFGVKFGCPMNDVESLLQFAKFHKLAVIGVSFHVGSCCTDAVAYSDAIKRSKFVFEIAKKVGFKFNLLDIGGGFSNSDKQGEITFSEIADEINKELKNSFSDYPDIRIIAEPGRFFASSTMTLVTSVIGKKRIIRDDNYNSSSEIVSSNSIEDNIENTIYHYSVNSSIYGPFNNIVFDKSVPEIKLLNEYGDYDEKDTYKSVIFGQTCDSGDVISNGIELPILACGDYLYIENHGAYTLASASNFNGFKNPKILYIFRH